MTNQLPNRLALDSGVLSRASSDIPIEVLADHLDRHYALGGDLLPLSGERDRNFRLSIDGHPTFVVKVAHPAENPAVIEAQALAANHARALDPGLPVQGVALSAAGRPTTLLVHDSEPRVVRVVDWLTGQVMAGTSLNGNLAASIGSTLARLGRALRTYSNAHASQDLLWNLANAGRLEQLLPHVADDPLRAEVVRALTAYTTLLPRLRALPTQAIHSDFNPHNLLVDATGSKIVGVLDFGDMEIAPPLCDLAIACAYLTGTEFDCFSYIEAAVAAYHREAPLAGSDASMLIDLIAMRHAMTILITQWRAHRYPDSASYILRNNPTARRGLTAFDDAGRRILGARLADILAS